KPSTSSHPKRRQSPPATSSTSTPATPSRSRGSFIRRKAPSPVSRSARSTLSLKGERASTANREAPSLPSPLEGEGGAQRRMRGTLVGAVSSVSLPPCGEGRGGG